MNRSNQMWAITIPKCDLKEFFFLGFIDLSKRLIVVTEFHQDNSKQLHMFIDLKKKANFDEIKGLLTDGFASIEDTRKDVGNIQTVKSASQWILYCLKCDPDPKTFNIDKFKLTFGQELTNWLKATENDEFKLTADFVKNHANQHSFLKAIHAESQRNRNRVKSLVPIFGPLEKDLLWWQREVIEWYNEFMFTSEPIKKHLWLCGAPGIDKTAFILDIIKRSIQNMNQFINESNSASDI